MFVGFGVGGVFIHGFVWLCGLFGICLVVCSCDGLFIFVVLPMVFKLGLDCVGEGLHVCGI